MTHEEFISLVRQPQTVLANQIPDLKEISDKYPYFVSPRLFLTKAFNDSGNIHFSAILEETTLYCVDRLWLHDYIFLAKNVLEEPQHFERENKTSGNYFDMIETIESIEGDSKQSLKNMAEKLKEARALVVPQAGVKISDKIKSVSTNQYEFLESIPAKDNLEINVLEVSEQNAKKLILERKYYEAIEILKALNLNNPKKSVYFADQIRFLEKVISNSKK